MKVLFICNQNQNRSITAENLFKGVYTTRSAGLYNQEPVTKEELSWADLVIVMEDEQREEIAHRFPKQYLQKKIISWNVPDIYKKEDPSLIKALEQKAKKSF